MFYYVYDSVKTENEVNKEIDKVTSIEDNKYIGNKNLNKISATHAATIGKKSFMDCNNLTDVYLGPDIRKIDELAFANCTSLTDVWFPMLDRNALVEISQDAFKNCGKLCFHIFGLGCSTCGNTAIEEYAKAHGYDLMGMI